MFVSSIMFPPIDLAGSRYPTFSIWALPYLVFPSLNILQIFHDMWVNYSDLTVLLNHRWWLGLGESSPFMAWIQVSDIFSLPRWYPHSSTIFLGSMIFFPGGWGEGIAQRPPGHAGLFRQMDRWFFTWPDGPKEIDYLPTNKWWCCIVVLVYWRVINQQTWWYWMNRW